MNYYISLVKNLNDPAAQPATLYDSGWPDGGLMLTEASLTEALDEAGDLAFKMPPDHPLYKSVGLMSDRIDVHEIYDGSDAVIFMGRAVRINDEKDLQRSVSVEGCLNWLADVPDTFTNVTESTDADRIHYKLGDSANLKQIEFTGTTDDRVLTHEWTEDDGLEALHVHEFDSEFWVEFEDKDGHVKEYRLPMEELYEWSDDETPVWKRVGYLGCADLQNEDYSNEKDSPGASAPFYIDNQRIVIRMEAEKTEEPAGEGEEEEEEESSEPVSELRSIRIHRLDPVPVSQLLAMMLPSDDKAGYRSQASKSRWIWLYDDCDVQGELIYKPEQGCSCLDTLRAWQKRFGGYLSVTYGKWKDQDTGKEEWRPYLHYRKDAGEKHEHATDVPIEYGLNVMEVSVKRSGENIVTAIKGTGTTDTDGKEYTLAFNDKEGENPPTNGDSAETIIAYYRQYGQKPPIEDDPLHYNLEGGYVVKFETRAAYGYIRQEKKYTLPVNNYRAVTPEELNAGNVVPKDLEWFIRTIVNDCPVYTLTNDLTPQQGAEYYVDARYERVTVPNTNPNPAAYRWYERENPNGNILRYNYKLTADLEPDAGKAYFADANYRRLYEMIKADLDEAAEGIETATIIAIDPRLLGVNALRPKIGDSYPANVTNYGVNGTSYVLTENRIDFVSPGRGRMTLGREKDLLSKQIIIIKKGNVTA